MFQIQYGMLLACFKEVSSQFSYTMIQKFEEVSVGGIQICNELSCPLMQTTDRFEVVFSTKILGSISMIHECVRSCRIEQSRKTIVEREERIVSGSQCVNHDKNAEYFALNIYSMSYYAVHNL